MECLEHNEICAWAEAHGLTQGENFQVRLPDLPSLGIRTYAHGSRSGEERAAAEDLVRTLGAWEECVVRIALWGVWPSSEDWPRFYAWRGAFNERRLLDVAPGHRFDRGEMTLLYELLTLIMENAWDADILCSRHGNAARVRGHISHDEWYEVREAPAQT
jgi:hypothetical protein